MSNPVWLLSVNLEAKTATFTSNLAGAARDARTSFQDIKSGSGEMGAAVGRSSGEARHAVMMLGEEFGIHLPRGVTSFIASLGPVSAAMEAAFPFIAIGAGAAVLLEHLRKVREEAEKTAQDEARFGTSIQRTFRALDEKILQTDKRIDELRGDHLGALKDELRLIDMQSLDDLASQFDKLAEESDKTLTGLKAQWFEFGSGSTGAAAALQDFKTKYDALLATGKGTEANNLLSGTLYSARTILAAMQTIRSEQAALNSGKTQNQFSPAERQAAEQALNALKAAGVQWTDKELHAQENLVQLLGSVETLTSKINTDKSKQQTAARLESGRDMRAAAMQEAEAERVGREQYVRELIETGAQARQTYEKSIQDMLDGTKEGLDTKLELIRQGLHEEEQAGLEGTEFYQHLAAEESAVQQQMKDEAKKNWLAMQDDQVRIRTEMVAEEARHQAQMIALRQSAGGGGSAADISRLAIERAQLDTEYQLKKKELEKELEMYREGGADRVKQAQQTAQALAALDQAHADKSDESQQQTAQAIRNYNAQVATNFAQTFMSIAEGHEHLTQTMIRAADQAITKLIEGSIQLIAHNKAEQLSSAKAAAAAAFKAVAGIPYVGPVLAPIAGASVYAGALAFEKGGIVPGVGRGDIVPAMLTPGEGVIPKGLMDGLQSAARNGEMGGNQTHYNLTLRPTYHVNTISGDGMQDALEKHTDQLVKTMEGVLRRMNR